MGEGRRKERVQSMYRVPQKGLSMVACSRILAASGNEGELTQLSKIFLRESISNHDNEMADSVR